MELSTLKKARVAMPSILLALVFAPVLYHILNQISPEDFPGGLFGDVVKIALLLVFLPLGYVYDLFQIRGVLNRASHERINRYVEDQLRLTLQPLVSSVELLKAPVGDKRWARLLYRQVDADPTLTELAKRIRDNGIRWTTAADIAVILIPGGIVVGLFASFQKNDSAIWYALGLALVGFLASMLIPTLERKHLSLCNDQQEHIRGFLGHQLEKDFRQIFSL